MLLCFLLLLLAIQDKCTAQKITPLQDTTETTEGDSVTLSCKYEGNVQNLQWYRQYPGSRPQFLLLIMESSKKSVIPADPPVPRLDGEVNMADKLVYLEISSVKVTDSALYYCVLRPTVTGNTTTLSASMISYCYLLVLLTFLDKSFGQSITQLQNETRATEGETVILSCKYDTQVSNLQWYRQYHGSRPEYLLLVYESNSVIHADSCFLRLNATVNKMKKQVDLKISSVKVTDSALYYCALTPTVTGNTTTLFTLFSTTTRAAPLR
ncbi:uncharacterized protein [Paramisgurnus dabryanus]|uniref:uncharacterized protein n=1 Tax=Paramisgurnus dabryanus TaxID=90735 RepID=UPI0031F3696A